MEEVKRNPYTGSELVKGNDNGEVIKVEDLVNKPTPEWEYKEPLDTLTNADSEHTELYDKLSKEPTEELEAPASISVEDLMNSDKKDWKVKEEIDSVLKGDVKSQLGNKVQEWENTDSVSEGKKDDLSFRNDELIQNLTGILGI